MEGPQFSVETDEGANADDVNQLLAMLSGHGVVDGGQVRDGSTPFGIDVMFTRGWFADSAAATDQSIADGNTTIGTQVTRSAATLDMRPWVPETHPRKVLICLPREETGNAGPGGESNTGPFEVVAGDPAPARPASFSEFKHTAEPALPDLTDRPDLLPLAAAWVGANEDGVEANHLWDRRQRPDATFRELYLSHLVTEKITDPGGVTHTDALAAASDATPAAINQAVNNNATHGSDAPHNYRTNDEILSTVRGTVDVDELSGADGTDGQIPFSDGTLPYWATPPDEWGYLQAAIDAATADGVVPSFTNGETVTDLTIADSVTYPDGTTETMSPTASAGGVAVLADLGDVQEGPASDRHAPSGSGDVFFATAATDSANTAQPRGVYYDDPAASTAQWTVIAQHPGDIDAGDLGFSPATSSDLGAHTGRTDNPHSVTASQAGALAENGTATNADHAVAADRADTLGPSGSAVGLAGVVSSGGGDLEYENGIVTHYNGHGAIHGARSVAEVERWVGDTTDVIVMLYRDNYHRMVNAYYDGSDFRYLVSNAPATRVQQSSNGLVEFATAPPSLSDEVVQWNTAIVDGGSINEADHAAAADGLTNQAKVIAGAVQAGHPDFSSPQDAVGFAATEGYGRVEVPPGTYGRLSFASGDNGLVIAGVGSAKHGARRALFRASGNAIQTDAGGLVFANIAVESTTNGDGFNLGGADVTIRDCYVDGARAGVRLGGSNCHMTGTRVVAPGSDRIIFGGGANNCTAVGNQGVAGRITDAGTDNVWQGLNS